MNALTRALVAATLLGAIATTVVAQTTPTPAPAVTSTHPNTKVYAYKKTAPAKETSPSSNASPSQMAHDPDAPPHGSQKWWELQNRYGQGNGE